MVFCSLSWASQSLLNSFYKLCFFPVFGNLNQNQIFNAGLCGIRTFIRILTSLYASNIPWKYFIIPLLHWCYILVQSLRLRYLCTYLILSLIYHLSLFPTLNVSLDILYYGLESHPYHLQWTASFIMFDLNRQLQFLLFKINVRSRLISIFLSLTI